MEELTERQETVASVLEALVDHSEEELTTLITKALATIKQRKEALKQAEVQVALDMLAETNALGNPTYSMSDVSKFTKVGIARIKRAQIKLEGK